MPRGNRRILAAIAGLILWGQAPSAQGVPSPPPAPEQQAKQTADNGKKAPSPLPVAVVESAEQAVASERREAESKQHDARDLDAQIRAAEAAEDQIFPSWVVALLSSVGTILIVWTLIETRRSNAIAKREYARARIEAKKAYAVATAANELAKLEKRPWLKIEAKITKAEFDGFCLTLRHETKIINVGQMVAERCAVRGGFVDRDDDPKGNRKIEGFRSEAERMAGIVDHGPRMPYPIIPGEEKPMASETQFMGDLEVRLVGKESRTTYIVFICARYHVPGEVEMRSTDRAFSIDYASDPDEIFGPYGIPVPIPDDLSPEKMILRPYGHNLTT